MENKSRLAIIGAGALIVLGGAAIAGPSLYASYSEDQVADAPSISMSARSNAAEGAATESATNSAVLAGSWQVSDGSEAGYRVAEVLNGQDVIVTGRTSNVEGAFTVSDDGSTLENAQFTVDVASITTDSDRRDSYFTSTTIDTANYPTAELSVSEPVDLGTPVAGETVTVDVNGELTLAGVTQPVTFTVEVASDGSQVQVASSIPITLSDYGIEAPSLGFVSVEESGAIEVQLVATPKD